MGLSRKTIIVLLLLVSSLFMVGPCDCEEQVLKMLILYGFILPCITLMVMYLLYMCYIWLTTTPDSMLPDKPASPKGLSASELQRVPRTTGKQLIMGTECAVCLDEIEEDQPARLVPGCNHGFHVACADSWLSKHPVCPVCRAKVVPQPFTSPRTS